MKNWILSLALCVLVGCGNTAPAEQLLFIDVGVKEDADTRADVEPDLETSDVSSDIAPDASTELGDILDELRRVDGITATELSATSTHRRFELTFAQPSDHDDPNSERFTQRVTLMFRSYDSPTVLLEAGYNIFEGAEFNLVETTQFLDANQIQIEHRFFGQSVPENPDWTTLTVEQAAADTHRLTTALKPLFARAWVGTGYSKGGMATLFHHYFYPEDFDAITPYVAPVLLSYDDERFIPCMRDIRLVECRGEMEQHQRHALENLSEIVDVLTARVGLLVAPEKLDWAVVDAILRGVWFRWQFEGPAVCDALPAPDMTPEQLADLYNVDPRWLTMAHPPYQDTDAFNYQARTEIGRSQMYTGHVDDLLPAGYVQERAYDDVLAQPWGTELVHDSTVMHSIRDWYRTSAPNVLAFYGEFDPNTCGAIEVSLENGSKVFNDIDGHHWTAVRDLSDDERMDYETRLRELTDGS